MEPNIPVKFGLAFLFLGLGFYTFVFGGSVGAETGFVSLTYFLLGYMLISTGELCISPIGLSMVTKLSPANIVGFIMGAWFLASAFGQYVAGLIGAWMAIPTVDGTSALPPQESLLVYTGVYYQIAVVSIISGVVILIISPFIKKWMHGVK
jgi:POT family proton-dependent oligopeptide transporter